MRFALAVTFTPFRRAASAKVTVSANAFTSSSNNGLRLYCLTYVNDAPILGDLLLRFISDPGSRPANARHSIGKWIGHARRVRMACAAPRASIPKGRNFRWEMKFDRG